MTQITTAIKKDSYAIRFSAQEDGKEVGRVWLYVLQNNLHTEPWGFLEDLYVDEVFRNRGIGKNLVDATVAEAKARGCYKLIFTTRHSKPETQEWYEKLGFKNWGTEFRMDLV